MSAKRIAVLVSGGGTNLQALIDAQAVDALGGGHICAVIASKPEVYALDRAEKAGIPALTVARKGCADIAAFSRAVEGALKPFAPDLIVLAGFLSILDAQFCETYPHIINIHPALIPAFCGKGMYGLKVHEAALGRGVKVTGATVHFVNAEADGGPIIAQRTAEVLPDDTAETLQQRVMTQCEQILLPEAVHLFCAGRLRLEDGRAVILEGTL